MYLLSQENIIPPTEEFIKAKKEDGVMYHWRANYEPWGGVMYHSYYDGNFNLCSHGYDDNHGC